MKRKQRTWEQEMKIVTDQRPAREIAADHRISLASVYYIKREHKRRQANLEWERQRKLRS